jgi:hypothetical protein
MPASASSVRSPICGPGLGALRGHGRRVLVKQGNRATQGVLRVGETEGAPGMTAGPHEGHAVAVRADAAVDDSAGIAAIDGNKGIDSFGAVAEQMLDAAQVTEALLAHVADKQEICLGLDTLMLEGAQHLEHGDEAAGVVTDSRRREAVAVLLDRDVGFRGKHRVQVRRIGNALVAFCPRATTDDISHLVHAHIGQSGHAQHFREAHGAGLFLERRGGYFRELDEFSEGLLLQRQHVVERGSDAGVVHQGRHLVRVGRAYLDVGGGRGKGKQGRRQSQGRTRGEDTQEGSERAAGSR